MITIATPLSAVNTMWSLSFLSSLIAKFYALVRLGLGGERLLVPSLYRPWFPQHPADLAEYKLPLWQLYTLS